jgi:membrane-associated phospholipid phosphatase
LKAESFQSGQESKMHSLLHLIQNIDLSVYYWLSRFHGSWFWDHLVTHQETNTFFKSGVLIALYWYFWFLGDRDQPWRRMTILNIFTGTMVGLVVTRLIATFAPFRVRPLYDGALHHQAMAVPSPTDFMSWSSFPSDHAAYLCALGFGIILLSRRLTIPVVLFLAGWVCMPRLYLGIHYLSDVVAGAAIGVFAVWAVLKIKWVNVRISRPLLAFADARPQVFFMVAYMTMYEMGSLFWDVREPMHAILKIARSAPSHTVIDVVAISLTFVCGIIAFCYYSATRCDDVAFTIRQDLAGPKLYGNVNDST